MAGIYSPDPFPVYPDGFPDCIIDEFIKKTGIPGILCNKPAPGTQIIAELGDEHVATGKPIVYTSGDSVFQIACHEDVVPVERLYEIRREFGMTGKHPADVCASLKEGKTSCHTCGASCQGVSSTPTSESDYTKLVAEITKTVMAQLNK